VSELWGLIAESLDWRWYNALGERYPQAIQHGLLTAAGICLVCGALGRPGFRLRL
jgi:hypothetical protein